MQRNNKGQFVKGTHWRPDAPFRHKDWLEREYQEHGRSAIDIAAQFGVTENAVLFWLHKHGIPRRSMPAIRKAKKWGASGSDNPMWNKRGELNPRWLGGVTPERQAFYTSEEWKRACVAVWKRDKACCRRCGMRRQERLDMPFHIHHIVSFAVRELRADPHNLVLLCEACHQFVHSRRNVNGDYLSQERTPAGTPSVL